ncbi:nucleotide exchange factor GrpE [Pseudaeromonas sharmana]|uniref:Protein GrpE n=1 Tax=Pseudaeromonas sharmana TaxID=328412 RepID=A0ABV8CR15_9GAMM
MSNQDQPMDQAQEPINEAELESQITDVEGELTVLQQKLEQAEAAVQEEKDRALRIAAEMENLRRRAAQDVEKAHKFALEKFAGDLLPVIDSLERALELSDRDNEQLKPTLEGVELTLRSMLATVSKFGVEVIDPQGTPFDPNKHQAMSMIENPDVAPNTVLAVMQKGYELNGRVIRPAMVMVARAPSVNTSA